MRGKPPPASPARAVRDSPPGRSPWAYFALVFALAVPFWIAGAVTGRQLLPGLPISALMAVCPLLAASILVRRERGSEGVAALLRRSLDVGQVKPPIWWLPILLSMPALMASTFFALRTTGRTVPAPQFAAPTVVALAALFAVGAFTEEAGWSGYAIDPLQERRTALDAALLVGAVWAIWHGVPYLQAGRGAGWIAGQFVFTVALRVLIVWVYNNAGRAIAAAIALHAMGNLSEFLFPVYGSSYDPLVAAPIATVAAAIVVIFWGPKTLARFRPG
jgi:membrane protease YdiL (CAAX protease family)